MIWFWHCPWNQDVWFYTANVWPKCVAYPFFFHFVVWDLQWNWNLISAFERSIIFAVRNCWSSEAVTTLGNAGKIFQQLFNPKQNKNAVHTTLISKLQFMLGRAPWVLHEQWLIRFEIMVNLRPEFRRCVYIVLYCHIAEDLSWRLKIGLVMRSCAGISHCFDVEQECWYLFSVGFFCEKCCHIFLSESENRWDKEDVFGSSTLLMIFMFYLLVYLSGHMVILLLEKCF